jgi:hypothetical protein
MKTLIIYIVLGILIMGIIAGVFVPNAAREEVVFTSGPLLGLFIWSFAK